MLWDEMLERAGDFLDYFGSDSCVDGRRIEFCVAQQNLDHANVDVAFEQMCGK